ncbi:MAG: DUF2357 domain-containing protein [Thermogemmatispora sp.]|uniref:DUF2357 domain-containing protein n=1 Tax=Thermogemmatispora sp. TaxID=1968838 RepID=UPI00263A304F|nr:DUF2357 domain-containing protein [Thermogemmatispora sp.]MBX5458134.1 DUF2357 domain-containing protein [Thermogemmatispora sp.]
MDTPASGASVTWLTINDQPLSFAPDSDNAALNIREYQTCYIKVTSQAPHPLSLMVDEVPLHTEHYGLWQWRPEHYAGLYRLTVSAPGIEPRTAWVRVFPQKLSQRLYEQMKSELAALALDLWFRLVSPAVERTAFARRLEETSPLHDYKQIRSIMEKLRPVMLQIRRRPHSTLQPVVRPCNWQALAHCSGEMQPQPGPCLELPASWRPFGDVRHLPQEWQVEESQLSYDVYENRLLKHFLRQQLPARLSLIEERALAEAQRREAIYQRYYNDEDRLLLERLRRVIDECRQMKRRCLFWGSEPFLKTVQPAVLPGKATQVLLKHPAYSRFFQLYLQFQQRLIVVNSERYVNELGQRKVSELYEMWSVFTMTHLAVELLEERGYRLTSNTTFYEVEKRYFEFEVRKNVASIVLAKGDREILFKYEPLYPHISTVGRRPGLVSTTMSGGPQMPDMAIEVYRNGEPQQVLVFDAKYRWQRLPNGQYGPKEEDINKMHRYRNNIQYQCFRRPGGPLHRYKIVASASILYPGTGLQAEDDGHIRAFPLLPGLAERRLRAIRMQLNELLTAAQL